MSETKPLRAPSILAGAIEPDNEKITDIIFQSVPKIMEKVKEITESDSVCTCKARVICTNATKDSVPHHVKNGEGLIHMGNIEELNKTNIELCENFEGCTKSPDGKCMIAQKYKEWIADQKWKAVDETSSQGEGKEKLNQETSYMVCTEYEGVIYFKDDGQALRPYINGEALLYLSNNYIKWLKVAEEGKNYPYCDEADSKDAQNKKTVTLGIGFTFCKDEDEHWKILEEVLGWTEEDINEIIHEIFDNGKDYSIDDKYYITDEQVAELFNTSIYREYIPNLNAAIKANNAKKKEPITYTQRELEAMFDFSYNSGLAKDSEDHTYSLSIEDEEKIIYYYLSKDQDGGVKAVDALTPDKDMRRRLNQMNLFFNPDDEKAYEFNENLDQLRDSLGF